MARDAVTGYYEGRSGNGRLWTLEEAVRHVRQTGEEAYYVEMDLQNLGGLNAALGHTGANEVYSAVAAIARRELSAVASEAAFFRHGGDETCAFLVNTRRRAVRAALDRVRRGVAELAAEFGVNDIPHPKHQGGGEFRGMASTRWWSGCPPGTGATRHSYSGTPTSNWNGARGGGGEATLGQLEAGHRFPSRCRDQ